MSTRTITVFSNKGGVGKTFVSVNLATTLAMSGARVLLMDMDFHAAHDMSRMLNIAPKHSLVNFLEKIGSIENPQDIKKFVVTHNSGLDFLPGVVHARQSGMVSPQNLKLFFKKIYDLYDYVVIDGGKIFSETLLTILDHSNLILLVATPDILAVYQIKWCLEMLQTMHFPLKMVKVVLNRAESRGGVAWQEVRSALMCDIFSLLPSDGRAVGMALNRGVPFVMDSPKTKLAEAFKKMGMALAKQDLYIEASGVEKARQSLEGEGTGTFWQKFGVSQHSVPGGDVFAKEQDEVVSLKKKIHEKLVLRLHVEDLSPETLSDPKKAQELKDSAQKIVADLLIEEKGALISSHEERSRIVREIVDEALGLGPLEEFLADPDVSDIMVNGTTDLYIEKHGKLILTNKKFVSEQQMRAIIDRIVAPLGRRIDESVPMVDARLPDGSRFNAIIPPLSLIGPMITIRKFGIERLGVEDLLEKHHSLNQQIYDFLQACVIGRKNIIVSGGTGAGKTTLLNVISQFIPDNERILTIEDAAELRLRKSHWGRLESRPPNVEGRGAVSIRELFINSLRMRPDRIIIGECRGPEVLDMLQAMNTGHDGSMTTLHANSTRDGVVRMSSMILLSGIELPVRAINEMISSAIDLIVHIARFSDGSRKITGVTEIAGLEKDFQLDLRDVFVFEQKGRSEEGAVLGDYVPTGYVPKIYHDLVTRGINIDKTIFVKKT
ncbi:MAG TPA: ATPase, T2SS/T4P/T4SS family [Candidatus Bathyarchaeia archaeon]|nr:ATPase, T2SS/T4P/T4SS family [Candidatus Bathyarchaeia archaeon]